MDEIAAGHYKHRISVEATEELGELIRSFNHMAADLEESRTIAQTSTQQLSAANVTLEERRRELETVLETIPSGVVNPRLHDASAPDQSRLSRSSRTNEAGKRPRYAASIAILVRS